jgi:hypothetical protein
MLQQLLVLIEKGEYFSQIELAKKFGVNLALFSRMLEQLVVLGYIEDLSCTTYNQCKECAAKGKGVGVSKHIWTLTLKGHRAAHENMSL